MNRNKATATTNKESIHWKRNVVHSLFILLSVMFVLQSCSFDNTNKNNKEIAIEKVSHLFEMEDKEKITEGESSKIKESTDQEQINEAMEAIDKIDTSDGMHSENGAVSFSLQSAVLNAQMQLKEREGALNSADDNTSDEQKNEGFNPDEDDIVLTNNELKNRDKLEAFMEVAGENGDNNESEIRVVKDEGAKGVLIYDLKSRYDKNADQRWISVIPDVSHYRASANETQNVFNTRQQCSYMSKDKQEGYYKLNECQTHWAYRFLPIIEGNEVVH